MRIGGLASGIDTDSIIRDMMKANRIPLTKIVQKKQYMDWQVNDYRTVNRQLNDFSTNIWDKMLSPTTSGFRSKTVEVSAPNDVSIKSVSSSGEFSGTLQIHQLAKHATLKSAGIKDGNDDLITDKPDTTTLADLGITGTKIEITSINKDGSALESKTVNVSSTDTLKSVLAKINSETGVNAFYDSRTGQIAMSAKHSGELKDADGNSVDEIIISSDGDIASKLGLDSGNAELIGGQDAIFTLNGLKMTRSSNTFEVNGFEFSLKQVTAPLVDDGNGNMVVADDAKSITFSSKASVDDVFDTVKNFVDEYNKMIEELNAKIREPKYRSYQPLSAEEKADMKENEIKLWEEKAMSGTLRNDPTITNMLSQMRTALMGSVGEKGQKDNPTLASIGITFSKDYLSNGKLEIDEDALKKAISEDPSKVEKMFTNSGKDVPQEEQGFAVRLRSIVDTSRTKITAHAGNVGASNETFSMGRTLKDMDKQIERFEDRMKMVEDRLWRQFTAMEQAINRANAQSAQLMNSLGGGM